MMDKSLLHYHAKIGKPPEEPVDPRTDKVRSLLNDPTGIIATDKVLAPFVDIAQAQVPIIAAALYAQAKGAYEQHDKLMRHIWNPPVISWWQRTFGRKPWTQEKKPEVK